MGPRDEYNDDSIYDPGAESDDTYDTDVEDSIDDELGGLNSADII